jgi:hypothetical protein
MSDALVEQLALDIHSGQAILFLGSGFSRSARNKFGVNFPQADQLKELLGSDFEVDLSNYSLEAISEHFVAKKGTPALYQVLADQFTAVALSKQQIALFKLPWKRIYTTNFDNVAEQGVVENRSQPITFDLDHDPQKAIPDHAVIHLNGSILTANTGNILKKITLTSSTYYDRRIEESGWGRRFLRDVSHARCLVFVGYSLFDIDIARLLRESPALKRKTVFVEAPSRDPIKETKLELFGTVIPLGSETVIDKISAFKIPPGAGDREYFVAFDEVSASDSIAAVSAEGLREFYLSGKHSWTLAFEEKSDRKNNVVERYRMDQGLLDLQRGVNRFVVHAKLGNGKTFFLRLLTAELIGRGYRVFWFHQNTDEIAREISDIKKHRSAIVFESVFGNENLVQFISESVGPSVPVFVTCRTAGFDLRNSALVEILGGGFSELNLNNFSEAERESFANALNKAGFWGTWSGRNDAQKRALISEWGNELRGVLLKLFAETDLRDRIKSYIENGAKREPILRQLMILAFLLKMAEIRAEYDVFDELLDISSYPIFRRNEEVIKEFFDVTGSHVTMRSSVLSDYCLRNVFDDEEIIQVLMDVARVQSRIDKWTPDIWQILKTFARYGFVEPLLTGSKKRQIMVQYYEFLRSLNAYIKRPLFWLQYAIAEMAVGRYDVAKTFLDSSQSYAAKIPNFKTHQIDNHYARYLLESRARSAKFVDFAAAFYRAYGYLSKEITSEGTSYFTARVIRYVAEFFKVATKNLSDHEKSECQRRLLQLDSALRAKMKEFKSPQPQFDEAIIALAQAQKLLQGLDVTVSITGLPGDFIQD